MKHCLVKDANGVMVSISTNIPFWLIRFCSSSLAVSLGGDKTLHFTISRRLCKWQCINMNYCIDFCSLSL